MCNHCSHSKIYGKPILHYLVFLICSSCGNRYIVSGGWLPRQRVTNRGEKELTEVGSKIASVWARVSEP